MSLTSVPATTQRILWGKAAGRCQYEGCNKPLWLDDLTKAEFNVAYVAHIVADTPGGTRGDPVRSPQLAAEIANLMLLCDAHHRLVDTSDKDGHPENRLLRMKTAHEKRVELLTSIQEDRRSHVLLYGANIGHHSSPVSYGHATVAMTPSWYPADSVPLTLGMKNSSFTDRTSEFWAIESAHLRNMVARELHPRLADGTIQHLSVFALAPQPLLVLLGSLIADLRAVEVYQYHKEPTRNWTWQPDQGGFDFQVIPPTAITGPPALVVSLSATIPDERITNALAEPATIWRLTIPEPHNDFLQSREQAQKFRKTMRLLMDRIKALHGEFAMIHVFPAMPVALAVEMGRILMPKADLPLKIYDENKALGGSVFALDINER